MWNEHILLAKCQLTLIIGFNLKVQNNSKIVSVIKKVCDMYTHNEHRIISRKEIERIS